MPLPGGGIPSENFTLVPRPCESPIPPDQVFVSTEQESIMGYSEQLIRLVVPHLTGDVSDLDREWRRVPCQLYGLETFNRASR